MHPVPPQPTADAEGLAAFDEFSTEMSRRRAEWTQLLFVGVLGTAFLVGQCVDASAVNRAERAWLPIQVVASLVGWAVLRYAPFARRRPILIAAGFAAIVAGVGGRLLGELGGLDSPAFYGVYTLPSLVVALPCRLSDRVIITVALIVPFSLGYFLPHPDYLNHPLVHIPVIYTVSVIVVSVAIGHWVYILTRERFVFALRVDAQRQELERNNTALSEEVVEKAGTVEQLSARIDTVRMAERSDLARALHDDIGQLIVGARMELGNLEMVLGGGEKSGEELAFLHEIVEALSRSTRKIVGTLRVAHDQTSILEAIDAVLAPIRHLSTLRIETQVEVDEHLEPAFREVICRTVQEGITNVLKHAEASEAHVRISQESAVITIAVRDNGRGLSTNDPEALGFGVLGVRERAESVGGRASLSSGSGGTTLEVMLPLTP